MENISLTAHFALADRKNYLAKFLTANQHVGLSNWGKAMFTHILKSSLFMRIPENVATEIAGPYFKGPVTIAIYRDLNDLVMILADKQGFVKCSLRNKTPRELEKIASALYYKSLPPTAWGSPDETAKQDIILGEFNALQCQDTPIYLAGV